jgi:hypothetical protein
MVMLLLILFYLAEYYANNLYPRPKYLSGQRAAILISGQHRPIGNISFSLNITTSINRAYKIDLNKLPSTPINSIIDYVIKPFADHGNDNCLIDMTHFLDQGNL